MESAPIAAETVATFLAGIQNAESPPVPASPPAAVTGENRAFSPTSATASLTDNSAIIDGAVVTLRGDIMGDIPAGPNPDVEPFGYRLRNRTN